jgi:hypothetical protein
MRFRFIEDHRADYPVRIMCGALEVSPAGYYAWRSRPESRRSAANRDLLDHITRVHRDTRGRYGSPRIHVELRAQGRGVSRGRIERLMRRQSFATVLIWRSVLMREGIARILRAANCRTPASVSCADDLPPGKLQPHQLLFLIVHTGDDFDVALEQIELLRDNHPRGRIAIVADHYRLDDLVSAFRAGANG